MSALAPRVLVAVLGIAALSTAQDLEPEDLEVLLVVGIDDDLPRPGAEVLRLNAEERARLGADGLVIVEPREIAQLRSAPWRGRTDPEGRVSIGRSALSWPGRLLALPPYSSDIGVQREGDHWVMKVAQHEPVGILVVDEKGTRLSNFPVALFGDGRPLRFGLSDAKGRAMLALEPGYQARLTAAPAGWIGRHDGFPTLAEGLPGKRGTTLTVPPHGTVRVRFQRGGVPQETSLSTVRVQFANEGEAHYEQTHFVQTECSGFELPVVALGTTLQLSSSTSERWSLQVPPLTRNGEVAEFVVDLGPVVTFELAGTGLPPFAHLQLRLVTDEGEFEFVHSGDTKDAFRIPCNRSLDGTRIVRMELDVQPVASGASQHWSLGTARELEIALPTAEVQFGTLTLVAQPVPLRGRVVDEAGNPVADARVVVGPEDPQRHGYVVTTATDGTFALLSRPFRDAKGKPRGLRAIARHGDRASVCSEVTPFGGEVELRLTRVVAVRAPDTGSLRVVVRGIAKDRLTERRLRLAHASGIRHVDAQVVGTGEGVCELTFEGLEKGTYSLVAQDRELGPFVVLDDLECDGRTACTDARLQSPIDLFGRMRTVEFVVRDHEGIPIAGARVTGRHVVRATDGKGTARVPWNRESKSAITIEKPGLRPVRLHEIGDRHEVVLGRPPQMDVVVKGMPADLARDALFVWVRGAERGNFDGNQARVGDGDVAKVDLPVPGDYRAILLVRVDDHVGGWHGSAIAQTEPFAIGEDAPAPVTIALDDAAVAHLREAIEKAKAAKR